MQNNLDYFNYSLKNSDEIFDTSNPNGIQVISDNPSGKPTNLMTKNKKLLEYITAYKIARETKNDSFCDVVIEKIIDILSDTKNINYSPFCNYFQVLGYSYNAFITSKLSVEEKKEIITTIVEYYIKYRHNLYLSHGYSDICLQINSDISSSRRKGKTGIEKIEETLKSFNKYNFIHCKDTESFLSNDYTYLFPDKGDTKIFDEFIQDNNINFNSRELRDGKNPDMLLKIKNDFFIIEHKLTNGGGGSQNAEINEIISFIKFSESQNKINLHYVSCLAGNYINSWNESQTANRQTIQFENISKNLNENPANYFVNGKGLSQLIKDYLDE